jgi:chromosome condensin MukBEF ATPase and DNA-binding subunit MukB
MCLWRYVRKRTIIEILPSRISHNKNALILQEIQNKNQNDQISSMKNKISNLEKRLEEQEQYSRSLFTYQWNNTVNKLLILKGGAYNFR